MDIRGGVGWGGGGGEVDKVYNSLPPNLVPNIYPPHA